MRLYKKEKPPINSGADIKKEVKRPRKQILPRVFLCAEGSMFRGYFPLFRSFKRVRTNSFFSSFPSNGISGYR